MAKAITKQQAVPSDWASTYAAQIASNIFKRLGENVSLQQVIKLISNPQSFHRHLLPMSASILKAELVRSDCFVVEETTQQSFMDYIHADSPKLRATGQGQESRNRIENLRQDLLQLSDNLTDADDELIAARKNVEQHEMKQYQAWKSKQAEHVDYILEVIKKEGLSVSKKFKKNLLQRLSLQAVDVELDPAICKALKIKGEPSAEVKAVVSLLLEELGYGE